MSQPEPRTIFDEGIRFECQKCGNCCTGAPGKVSVTMPEIEQMAHYLRMPQGNLLTQFCRFDDGLLLKEKGNGDCVFLQGGSCMVYPARPRQCRTFPFWVKNLRSESAWNHTCTACPGIGRGKVHSKDEIYKIIEDEPVT